jgi:hypothetical protein
MASATDKGEIGENEMAVNAAFELGKKAATL